MSRITFRSAAAGLAASGLVLLVGAPVAAGVVETPPPTPQAECGPDSRPETGLQGRVSVEDHESGRAADGYTCNTEVVGSYVPEATDGPTGTVGGFKVLRYVDATGNDCAYYDTTLLWPTGGLDSLLNQQTTGGVNVMDMADPTNPTLTATLQTFAMQTPHESLVLSEKRGILAAVGGNPATQLGIIDVYDISSDCREPVLLGSSPLAFLGHESGLSPDGNTFYSASPGTNSIVAVDISDPLQMQPLWFGEYDSHGISISDDGTRAYVSGTGSGLYILDVTQVQERVENPTVPELSFTTWPTRSIPQNALPFSRDGVPYLLEIDEYGQLSNVGAGRIIDISDETAPQIVSDLRLEVHQPENFDTIAGDPGAGNPVQGYAGHYCSVPTRVDPTIAACSMILSGLRIFDISDLENPVEIAYFNAPIKDRPGFDEFGQFGASNYAMSMPAWVPERNELWYSDGFSGFYVVRVAGEVWPAPAADAADDDPSAAAGDGDTDDEATGGADLAATGASRLLTLAGLALLAAGLGTAAAARRERHTA